MKPGDIYELKTRSGEYQTLIQKIEIINVPLDGGAIIGQIVDVKIKKILKKSSKPYKTPKSVV